MVADISPSSGDISETKQDRAIVTMKHYHEVGGVDSVVTFRSSPGYSPVEIFWFQIKACSDINTASCLTCRQTTAVVNSARRSSHRRCCQLL